MRIAQISPLYESVPPALYGGTERVVSYLTEELIKAGHEVSLFASGDSKTKARLIPVCECALRLDPRGLDPVAFHYLLMEEVLKREGEFDIIHSHIDCIGFVLGRRAKIPVVSTLHGRLDRWEHRFIFKEFSEMPVISISNSQRTPLPGANWAGTVYHGVPGGLYKFHEKPGDYLVYVGRVSPEKKVDSAIEIANLSGVPLKIAAKVDNADLEYFKAEIKPLLKNSLVEFLGEINDKDKNELIGNALAFLHPIDWPEPFGLSMIESMACGTPVLARRRGSIPEVIDDGITGFIFEEDKEAADYVNGPCRSFSRTGCRMRFEERFLSGKMAEEYLKLYGLAIDGGGVKVNA
ncbi:MAG: glycosyltransferase family 4 protein [Deltaproteobacteria bacterium]|nr:glycosyltransferase family 4 protein [Deltaproteobacteria bacterium]